MQQTLEYLEELAVGEVCYNYNLSSNKEGEDGKDVKMKTEKIKYSA